MIFGRYGWVRMSEKWIAEWKKEFKVSQDKIQRTTTFSVSPSQSSFARHFVYGRRFESFFGHELGTLGG